MEKLNWKSFWLGLKIVMVMAIKMSPTYSFATIEVAFLESQTYLGRRVQLEPNGRFSHIAISYGGKWLHANPLNGVEWVSQNELRKIGEITRIIIVSQEAELSSERVSAFIGKPYDDLLTWDDEKMYCSELVAKLLDLKPKPMLFDPTFWKGRGYDKVRGSLGLSPDDIFHQLISRGYKVKVLQKDACRNALSNI